jgi:hypothetical protein
MYRSSLRSLDAAVMGRFDKHLGDPAEIVENLEAALEQFRSVARELVETSE